MSKEDRVAGGILDENDKQNVGSPELFFWSPCCTVNDWVTISENDGS